MSRELMQQALEAVDWLRHHLTQHHGCLHMDATASGIPAWLDKTETALRERLAQPEQEPVAHTLNCVCGAVWDIKADGSEQMAHTPDTIPPQRKPLTEKRIEELYSFWVVDCQDIVGFARAVERTVKGEV